MVAMESEHPAYSYAEHKGYRTRYTAALAERRPCPAHRYSFINVRRVATPTGTRLVTELIAPDQRGEVG